MINKNHFAATPMGKALAELSERVQDMPPVSLNVIGGFALMLREIRDPMDTTDIDYVGQQLPADFTKISDEIGMKHHLGKGWINNDVMLSGISQEDFEFATGELHFEPAFSVGSIRINVLDEKDLLRLKIIAVDTSLTGAEMGGEFSRAKDLPDVKLLMKRQGVTPEDLNDQYGEYIMSDITIKVIRAFSEQGMDAVHAIVDERNTAYMMELRQCRDVRSTRSPFIENLLNDLQKRYEAEQKDF